MAVSLAIALRTLFCTLGCVMLATLIYTLSIDGLPFRKDLLTPWMAATLVDFYINIVAIGAWVFYKESNWISAIIWAILLVCFGSITTCGYIILQFFKLSSQESLQDPLYFVLLQHKTKDEVAQKRKFSVVSARVLFSALCCLMLGTLVYTLVTDGSPFRRELLTPWMVATLIDFYINVVALSVWVVYKESSWIGAFLWIVLLICFGSITTCAYIVRQLFHLSSQDPVYLVLFSSSNSKMKLPLWFDVIWGGAPPTLMYGLPQVTIRRQGVQVNALKEKCSFVSSSEVRPQAKESRDFFVWVCAILAREYERAVQRGDTIMG